MKKIITWVLICAMIFNAKALNNFGIVFAAEIEKVPYASPSEIVEEFVDENEDIDENEEDGTMYEDEPEEDEAVSEDENINEVEINEEVASENEENINEGEADVSEKENDINEEDEVESEKEENISEEEKTINEDEEFENEKKENISENDDVEIEEKTIVSENEEVIDIEENVSKDDEVVNDEIIEDKELVCENEENISKEIKAGENGEVISEDSKVVNEKAELDIKEKKEVTNAEKISSEEIEKLKSVLKNIDEICEVEEVSSPSDVEDVSLNQLFGAPTYAQTGGVEYNLSFNMHGHGDQIPTQHLGEFEYPTRPSTSSVIGYKLVDWYTNDSFTTPYDFNHYLTTDETAHAKWELITYNIVFDAGIVDATTPSAIVKTYGTDVGTLSPPTDIPDGYTFIGWWIDTTPSTEYTGIGDLSTTDGDTVTLKAKWKAKVRYHANGHGTDPDVAEAILDTNIILSSISNVTGYINDAKWYKELSCTTVAGNMGGSFTITELTDLYVKWSEKVYNIEYELNGGSWTSVPGAANFKRKYTESKTLLTIVKRTAYDFAGWYDNAEFSGTAQTSVPANTDSDKKYYAKWNLKEGYNIVSFNTHGGSIVNSIPVASGNTIKKPSNPTLSGCTFVAWYMEEGLINQFDFSTPITESITLHAKWVFKSSDDGGGGSGSGSGGGGGGGANFNFNNQNNNTNILQNGNAYINEGPATNKNIRLIENPTITMDFDGTLSVIDGSGNFVEGFCKIKDANNVEQYYYFTNDHKMYCGWLKDEKGNIYHFDDIFGYMNRGEVKIGEEIYTFNEDGLYNGDKTKLPANQNLLEAMSDNWVYDPVDKSWSFVKKTSNGEIGDTCVNGIYEIGNGENKKMYCFDEKGKLMIGVFSYIGKVYYTSNAEADAGAILGEINENNELIQTKVEPTAKLKIMSVSIIKGQNRDVNVKEGNVATTTENVEQSSNNQGNTMQSSGNQGNDLFTSLKNLKPL